jgi:hypothetical protein
MSGRMGYATNPDRRMESDCLLTLNSLRESVQLPFETAISVSGGVAI